MKQNFVRRLGLVFLCFTLIAACVPAIAADALFEAEIALIEGDAPTQFSVWPSAEHVTSCPDDPALLVQVTPPVGDAYSFLFPFVEGREVYSLVPLLRFTDINGDGYLDVEALFAQGASNVTSTYFLYDPADSRLHYSAQLGLLSNAYYDPERHVILSQVSDGAPRQYYSLFGLVDSTPILLRTASMEAFEAEDGYVLKATVTSAVTGAVLLDETVPFGAIEAAVWNAQYERMEQALYDGIDNALATDTP